MSSSDRSMWCMTQKGHGRSSASTCGSWGVGSAGAAGVADTGGATVTGAGGPWWGPVATASLLRFFCSSHSCSNTDFVSQPRTLGPNGCWFRLYKQDHACLVLGTVQIALSCCSTEEPLHFDFSRRPAELREA